MSMQGGAGGNVVGEAVILIKTSDAGLQKDVETKVKKAAAGAKAEAKIGADTKEAEQKIGSLQGSLGKLGGKAQEELNKALGPASKLTGQMGSLEESAKKAGSGLSLLGIGAGVAAAGIAAFAASSLGRFREVAEEVNNLQDVMGGTAQDASRLRNVAVATGTGVDVLTGSVFKLSQNLDKNRAYLDANGIAITKNKDGTTDLYSTILNISDAYTALEDPIAKNELLVKTFGKSGKELIDILELGRDKIEALAAAGPIISEKDIERSKNLSIQMKLLRQEWDKLRVKLGEKIVSPVTNFAAGLNAAINDPLKALKQIVVPRTAKGFFAEFFGGPPAWLIGTARDITDLGKKTDGAKESALKHAAAMDEERKKAELLEQQLSATADAQVGLIDKTLSLTEAHHSAWEAADQVRDAQQKLNDAIKENGPNSKEAEDATRDLEAAHQSQLRTLVNLAQAMADNSVQQEIVNGHQVDGAQKADLLRQALHEVADTVEDPLRTQILGLANNIKVDLPSEKKINIDLNTDDAKARLAELTRIILSGPLGFLIGGPAPAYTPSRVDSSLDFSNPSSEGGDAASTPAPAPVSYPSPDPGYDPNAGYDDGRTRQGGGPMFPGYTYTVGEVGPERATVGRNGVTTITPMGGTRRGGDRIQYVNVTINNPMPEPGGASASRAMRLAASELGAR